MNKMETRETKNSEITKKSSDTVHETAAAAQKTEHKEMSKEEIAFFGVCSGE